MSNDPIIFSDSVLISFYGLIFVFGLTLLVFLLYRRNGNLLVQYGFLGLSPGIIEKFFPLEKDTIPFVDLLSKIGDSQQSFYGDPSQIVIEKREKGCFVSDENVKVTLSVNKKRHRKIYLKDGDFVEFGNLQFLFINDLDQHSQSLRTDGKRGKNKSIEGRMPEGTPCIISQDSKRRNIFLNKSVTYIGKSESNDIVIKVKDVSLKHAFIKRISGGKYKLVDLNTGNTFVNGRKTDEKYLMHNDEILFDTVRYKYSNPFQKRFSQSNTRKK